MLRVELPCLKYHRILTDEPANEDLTELKKDDYSFIIAYRDFKDNDYHIIDKNACLIDLTKGLDNVLQKFNSTSRNQVKRADKIQELQFHFGLSSFKFDDYFNFHANCEKDRNWYPVPPEELKNSLVFSATYEGQLISGISCYAHSNRIRIGRIFSNKRSHLSEKLTNLIYGAASKRLVFEICKYAITRDFVSLDLGGVDLIDPSKSGITMYKLSLGGNIIPIKLARFYSKNYTAGIKLIKANGWDLT